MEKRTFPSDLDWLKSKCFQKITIYLYINRSMTLYEFIYIVSQQDSEKFVILLVQDITRHHIMPWRFLRFRIDTIIFD